MIVNAEALALIQLGIEDRSLCWLAGDYLEEIGLPEYAILVRFGRCAMVRYLANEDNQQLRAAMLEIAAFLLQNNADPRTMVRPPPEVASENTISSRNIHLAIPGCSWPGRNTPMNDDRFDHDDPPSRTPVERARDIAYLVLLLVGTAAFFAYLFYTSGGKP